jgi:hypothetical protein
MQTLYARDTKTRTSTRAVAHFLRVAWTQRVMSKRNNTCADCTKPEHSAHNWQRSRAPCFKCDSTEHWTRDCPVGKTDTEKEALKNILPTWEEYKTGPTKEHRLVFPSEIYAGIVPGRIVAGETLFYNS